MTAPQVFKVLTDFRFEIGSAVLGANRLQDSVNQISDAADRLNFKLARIGFNLGPQLGLFPTTMLGVFSSAIKAADKFKLSQLEIVNMLSANKEFFTGDIKTFEERSRSALSIMKDISKTARQFSIPERELFRFTKVLTSVLAPKGLAGTNLDIPIDMARTLLKSAPTLGVHPSLIESQLMDIVSGGTHRGSTLFRRLSAETGAMRPFGGKGGAAKFNLLPVVKRVEILRKSLNQFASDTEVVSARMQTISFQMQLLRDNINGLFGVLRPLGEVLQEPILKIFNEVNRIVKNYGPKIVGNFAEMMRGIIESPRKFAVSSVQLAELKSDVKKTGSLFTRLGIATLLGHSLKYLWSGAGKMFERIGIKLIPGVGFFGKSLGFLGSKLMFLSSVLAPITVSLFVLGDILKRMGVNATALKWIMLGTGVVIGLITFAIWKFSFSLKALGFTLGVLNFAFSRILMPILLIVALMQILSRAQGYAAVEDLKNLPDAMLSFSESLAQLKNALGDLISPFSRVIDFLALQIAPLFEKTLLLQTSVGAMGTIVKILDFFGKGILNLQAIISGVTWSIMQEFQNLKDYFEGFSLWKLVTGEWEKHRQSWKPEMTAQEAFWKGYEDFIAEHERKMSAKADGTVVNRTTNVGKVEINNKFKEQMEPDRIAFTMVDQLTRLGQNPTQAKRRSFQPVGLQLGTSGI